MSSAKKLIVNADDFAIDPAVNRAIITAFQEGILSSTTILASGKALEEGLEMLQSTTGLGVGLHLCLVDQKPVSEPSKIPSLVGNQGCLHKSHLSFIFKYSTGRIKLEEVEIELEAQIRKILDAELKLTHLDSHQHLHLLPQIVPVVGKLAQKYNITRIRIPLDDVSIGISAGTIIRRFQSHAVSNLALRAKSAYAAYGLTTTDYFFGFAVGGAFKKNIWEKVIQNLSPGVTEIMVHPGEDTVSLRNVTGWDYSWEEEYRALLSKELKTMLSENNIALINFGDLN